jgi:hypothetical protein
VPAGSLLNDRLRSRPHAGGCAITHLRGEVIRQVLRFLQLTLNVEQ